MEIFKVYALDRIQQQRTWSRSLIFLLVAVFKVSPQVGTFQFCVVGGEGRISPRFLFKT